MDSIKSPLFEVFLRLRPPPCLYPSLPMGPPLSQTFSNHRGGERFLTVTPPTATVVVDREQEFGKAHSFSKHITIHPPSESRKRAVEKFAFTRVFEESTSQLDVFEGVDVPGLVEGVLDGCRDGLIATLGVTGSGKSHTILGSKTQRGITQLSLDMLFQSLGDKTLHAAQHPLLIGSLIAADSSEAHISSAGGFFEGLYGETVGGFSSRAATPMTDVSFAHRRMPMLQPSLLPTIPDISSVRVASTDGMDYTVLVSMYEVYNDRIFDLLSHPRNQKDNRRRPLLFKFTEGSPDRKVVAGLKKVVCGSYEEALMVLETGLTERSVAGTGSNSVSSRSHGFFCLEVKKRRQGGMSTAWTGSQLTIVDLAGSERARNAKTAGATLAEAGKINESLMYLGQCLQLQGDLNDGSKSTVVPYRQCKLTELLFSNSFLSASALQSATTRNPQKGVMIVTADPVGDFNATSQILRYSALAKEITVPRIPSVTDIVFNGAAIPGKQHDRELSASYSADLEAALIEIESLSDQVELLAMHLAEERLRREEAEEHWQRAEARCEAIETEIREECWNEVEKKMDEEKRRWANAMGEEADRNDAHLDRKLEILAQSIQVYEDPGPSHVQDLAHENATLQMKIQELERQLLGRSTPTTMKGRPLQEIKLTGRPNSEEDKENQESGDGLMRLVASLNLQPDSDPFVSSTAESDKLLQLKIHQTPGKKIRKLTPRSNIGGCGGFGEDDVDEAMVILETP